MTTPIASILFMALAALLGALAQYLYKSGADAADGAWLSYVVNIRIVGGVVCYVGVMVLFIAAFRLGGSLTVLYPIYGSTFIWAAFIAWKVFDTPISVINLAGMLTLVLGMYLMGRTA